MNHSAEHRDLAATVRRDAETPLSELAKAVQPEWVGLSARTVCAGAPRLLSASTPMMTLDAPALAHNIAAMAEWCASHNVQLAPHGKTTMAPALWLAQLEAGAWGITVATEAQLRMAHSVGVKRVQLANMLIRPEAVRWLSTVLDADDSFTAYTWVDSIDAVTAMSDALSGTGARRPIMVLVEVGAPGARTGARTHAAAMAVAAAVLESPHLALAGVSGYEGVITHGTTAEDVAQIDDFLQAMAALHDSLLSAYEVDDIVLTAGGSAYFDRVVDILGNRASWPEARGRTIALVVRSGVYLVHDDGIYARLTPYATRNGPEFQPAVNVWARVISIPEPTIAYLDAGRRDLLDDEGWPVPLDARRRDGDEVHIVSTADHAVTGMNDQHVHVALPPHSELRVGDVVRLGVSHPCTTFDKWTHIGIIDNATAADPHFLDLIRTRF